MLPPPSLPHYDCVFCGRELEFANVEFMSTVVENVITIRHTCECRPEITARKYKVDHGAIKRLLNGFRLTVPYSAAPGPSLPLLPEAERLAVLWAWECEQLRDADEFLLFARHPVEAPAPPQLPKSPE